MSRNTRNLDINSRRKALSDLLECTICLEVASFPIFNCVPNGHIICGICNEKVKKCGICQYPLSPSFLGEALSRKVELTTSCPNSEEGCSQTVRCSEMKAHLANCYFREGICNKRNCVAAKFSFSAFCQHLKEKHLSVTLLGKPFNLTFSKTIKDLSWEIAVEVKNEIFCSIIVISSKYKTFFTWMTVLGDQEKAKKYMYKFQIIKENNVRSWTFPVLPHHDYNEFKGPSRCYLMCPLENLFLQQPTNKLTLAVMFDIKVL